MKAFVYLRLSVDKEDGRAQSIDAQRYEVELYAKAKGYEIVGEFVDSGVSGRKTSRPQFDNMISLACAKPGPVKAILVYRLDRFARNQQVFHNTIAYLDAARVQLISVSEYFGNGRQSRYIMSHTAIGAEQYSINASIQTAKSRRDNARRGHWNGGPIPFGYETYPVAIDGKKERMRLRIVEKEAMIVREIFDWADLGRGGRWICKTLNDRGTKMRGARWSNSNLAGLLSREHYRGTILFLQIIVIKHFMRELIVAFPHSFPHIEAQHNQRRFHSRTADRLLRNENLEVRSPLQTPTVVKFIIQLHRSIVPENYQFNGHNWASADVGLSKSAAPNETPI